MSNELFQQKQRINQLTETEKEILKLKRQDQKSRRQFYNVGVLLFLGTLVLFFFVGLLFPLRPKESEIEKRTLAKFPEFKLVHLMDGTFTNQLSTWYADTFPFRNSLIQLNANVENLFGIRGTQLVSNSKQTADDIPDEIKTKIDSSVKEVTQVTESQSNQEQIEEEKSVESLEVSGDLYIVDDFAFDMYYFYQEGVDSYIEMIEFVEKKLPDSISLYNIVVPLSSGIYINDELTASLGASDQKATIDYIYKSIFAINPRVNTVDIFDNLLQHNDEYLYFRTDHHWTQKAAYYSYQSLANRMGVTAVQLTDLTYMEFPDFIGTNYATSGQNPALAANPDTVETWRLPNVTNMTLYDKAEQAVEYPIIQDVSEWDKGMKYNAFIGGDQPLVILKNSDISNGKNAVLIKESFGNAFAPFLMANFENVLVVDSRHFFHLSKYNNDILKLMTEYKVTDVIILNNISAASNLDRINEIRAMFK